jgi:hypothetical protein
MSELWVYNPMDLTLCEALHLLKVSVQILLTLHATFRDITFLFVQLLC